MINDYSVLCFTPVPFQAFITESHKSHYGSTINPNAIFTVITSAFIAGGMVGAMVGGVVADKMGRKRGLIISQVVMSLVMVVLIIHQMVIIHQVVIKLMIKIIMIISQVVGLLGGIVMAVSEPLTSWEVLLVGRLVAGLTAGLNTVPFCSSIP